MVNLSIAKLIELMNIEMALLTLQRNKNIALYLMICVSSYKSMGILGFSTIQMDILERILLLQNITSFVNNPKLM